MQYALTRLFRIGLVVLGVVALPQISFAEGKKPVGGCAATFELMSIERILAEIASPDFPPENFEAEDLNDDNLLCVKLLPNNPLFEPVTFLFFDNNKRP
jgi:hypothetical protein